MFKKLIFTNTLNNVNEAIKTCRFLQFLNKNETKIKNYKIMVKSETYVEDTISNIAKSLAVSFA